MGRRISILLVILTLQAISFVMPETRAQEKDLTDTKSERENQRILKLRIEVKTGPEEDILKAMGLNCEWGANVDDTELSQRQALCNATVSQMDQLKKAGIAFEVEREGIRIEKKRLVRRPPAWADFEGEKEEKGVVWDSNGTNYSIPYFDWVYSPITISSTPAGATVYSIDVHFEVIHPYVGDLAIDLTDEDIEQEYRLWDYEGGSQHNIDTTIEMIGVFMGELANQTWKLYAWDGFEDDAGYIDYWWIQIWYQDPPDLIVDSLTATNYSPNVGDYIDVTMVIKNQGNGPAYGWFYNGLFYDLSSPPNTSSTEDEWWSTDVLASGQTESNTFYSITSSEPGTWHMYGLADCDGEVVETNEANNHKGPITINWIQPVPDLIVQSITLDDYSLVITEHTNGTITIKNQGSGPVVDCFYTDVFVKDTCAPSPPATGDYFWEFCWLDPGETICYDFYKLPHSTSSENWEIWGLVDSWPYTWGNVQESNEGNNTHGPVNITWIAPPSPVLVTRTGIIDRALEFSNAGWTCSNDNIDAPWFCPIWTCAFSPGQYVTGEAYSWGGWDKPSDFLTYLSGGLCAGSIDTNTCTQADPYWAAGVDCAGLVSRCWKTNARKDCPGLGYVSDQITVDALQPGDIMNRSTGEHRHVRMFYQWVVTDSIMQVVESTPPLVQDDNHYYVTSLLAQGYVPRRYKYVDDPENNDPVIDGHIHCKYPLDECGDCIKPGEEMTIEISAYDPDGDSISYEWISLWGYFIVNGETTYVDTTTENFITYLAPYWQYDNLWVSVRDGRGGMASIESEFDVFEQADSCDCGDPNGDGVVNVGDVCYLVTYLYKGGPEPVAPIERADASNDCLVDVADVVYLVAYLYQSGPPPECCWFPPE